MTIPSETNRSGPYSCNGATDFFPFSFKIYDESHIRVVKTDASSSDVNLVLGTDYTVDGVGSDFGGTISTTTAYAAGNKITILLNVPFTQEVDLENQGAYFAETIERALDMQTQRILQLREKLARAIVLPPTETSQVTISAETLNDIAVNAELVAQYKDQAAASAAAAAVFDPTFYALKATKLKVGSGLSINGVAGSDVTPAEGDLSADRLISLDQAALSDTIVAIAGGRDPGYGAVNSTVFARTVAGVGNVNAGGGIAGASLRPTAFTPAGALVVSSIPLTGTWRNMGPIIAETGYSFFYRTA